MDSLNKIVLNDFLILFVEMVSSFVGAREVEKLLYAPVSDSFFKSGTEAIVAFLSSLDAPELNVKIGGILSSLSTNFGNDLIENRLQEVYSHIELKHSPELGNNNVLPLIPTQFLSKYRVRFLPKVDTSEHAGGEVEGSRKLSVELEGLRKLNAELEQKVADRTEELRKLFEEQRKRDAELIKANEELRLLSTAKDQFVALISHELRTPLTGIRWLSERLEKSADNNVSQEHLEIVRSIRDKVSQMVDLINAILDSSRIESGTFSCQPVEMDIVATAKVVVSDLGPMIAHKGVRVEETYTPGSIMMLADASLWRSIVQNLVFNAIKYTPQSGYISLAITQEPSRISLTVRDTGCGIPADQQARIFMKLFRATNARSVDPDGLGLGLYIVKSIVTKAGGDIYFESEENKGATFHVIFPTTGMRPVGGTARI